MILFLKIIQFIILILCVLPSMYIILHKLLINNKKFNKHINNVAVITLLISFIIFILISICITSNSEIYSNMKYGVFHQMWNIIRGFLYLYGLIIITMTFILGIISAYIFYSGEYITNSLYHVVEYNKVLHISKKFHIKDKLFIYPHLYIETIYFVKHTSDDAVILSNKAYRELIKYSKKIKGKRLKRGFHYI